MTLQFSGVLYAVLGLSLGHWAINQCDTLENEQQSLQYRFSAIRQVIQWLEELEGDTNDPDVVEAGLAIMLILVLHDVGFPSFSKCDRSKLTHASRFVKRECQRKEST